MQRAFYLMFINNSGKGGREKGRERQGKARSHV